MAIKIRINPKILALTKYVRIGKSFFIVDSSNKQVRKLCGQVINNQSVFPSLIGKNILCSRA